MRANHITLLLFVVNLASDRPLKDEPGWYALIFSVLVFSGALIAEPHHATSDTVLRVCGVAVSGTLGFVLVFLFTEEIHRLLLWARLLFSSVVRECSRCSTFLLVLFLWGAEL